MESKLEKLLLKKRFSELSLQEKKYALSRISEMDYDNFHLLLTQSKVVFKTNSSNMKVNAELKEKLSAAFNEKYKKQHISFIFKKWFNNKSVLKPVMAIGIVITGFIIVARNVYKPQIIPSNTTNSVTAYLLQDKGHTFFFDAANNDPIINDSLVNEVKKVNDYLRMQTEGLHTFLEIPEK